MRNASNSRHVLYINNSGVVYYRPGRPALQGDDVNAFLSWFYAAIADDVSAKHAVIFDTRYSPG